MYTPCSIALIVTKKACNHYKIPLVNIQAVNVSTREFAARTYRKDLGKQGIKYTIYLTENTKDLIVHEIAHIIAWECPKLNAAGHNNEYMDILYTLTELTKEIK